MYKKLKNITLLFAVCLLFSNNTSAKENKLSNDENSLEYNLYYYQQTKKSISINEVLKVGFNKMPDSKSFGANNGIYWIKLQINNNIEKDLIAFIPTHNIDKIELYKLENSGLNYISSSGNSIPKDDLPVYYKFPAFNLEASKTATYYLKTYFLKEANFPIKILSEKKFTSRVMSKKTINSMYYGTCLMIFLLNIFFFIKFKEKYFLYYLVFIVSIAFNFLLYDGSLIDVFRGNAFYYKLETITHLFEEISLLFFSISFLGLKTKSPKFKKISFVFPIAIVVLYLLFFITDNYIISAIGDLIGISIFPILWVFGIYYIKEVQYAKFYVLGYLLILPLAVMYFLGYSFGWWKIDGEMLILKIVGWFDMIVFTYAISYRMKVHQDENNKTTINNLINQIKNIDLSSNTKLEKKLIDPYFVFLTDNKLTNQPLTLREIEILKSINKGLNNAEIAEKFFISKNTVKYHIRNIYSKVEVNNRKCLEEKIFSLIEA